MADGTRYLSLDQAAEYLGCSERTIRRYIAMGRINGYRLGSRLVRVDRDELAGLLRPIPTMGRAS